MLVGLVTRTTPPPSRRGPRASPTPVRRRRALAALSWLVAACGGAGRPPNGASDPPEAPRTAEAWIVTGGDSVALTVEVASTRAQHETGLAGRASLPEGRGMLFVFPQMRGRDEGFWMLGTAFPLDIAFLDADGRILRILRMEPCPRPPAGAECPGYFPDAPYASALETPAGWLSANGVQEGARVRWRYALAGR